MMRLSKWQCERGRRQAMPHAEPALSLLTLHLPAVIGAATLRGRQSPHPLRVSWGPPSGYPWESFGADLALLHAHCHDTWHARPEGEEWRRPDPEGERPLAPLIAATLARGGWLDPLRARRDLHPVRSTKLAWRTNGLRYLLVGGRGQCLRCRKSPKPEKCL